MLFPSSLWGTLGNPRDRLCNDICFGLIKPVVLLLLSACFYDLILSQHAHKNWWKNFKSKQYSAPDITLLLSGDIEMNPGPAENGINISICLTPQDNSILFTTRLHRHGLRPLDVVGGGDCYFRVSIRVTTIVKGSI